MDSATKKYEFFYILRVHYTILSSLDHQGVFSNVYAVETRLF
jgi:hypothetical protein